MFGGKRVETETRLLLARDEHLMAQVEYLQAWVANLDQALFAIKSAAELGGDAGDQAARKAIDDYKSKSASIRAEAMAAKEQFPVHPEGLR